MAAAAAAANKHAIVILFKRVKYGSQGNMEPFSEDRYEFMYSSVGTYELPYGRELRRNLKNLQIILISPTNESF